MAKVSTVKCNAYDQEQVNAAIHKALEMIGGMEHFVKPGQRVLLKVNALSAKPPEAAVTTHPTIIKAVAQEVKNAGGTPVVGDSSGGMIAGQAPTKHALQVSGIAQAAKEAEVELINFDISGVKEISGKGPVNPIHIARPALEADVVISLPKLKTHSAAVYTGAVKNLYGCVPGFRKAEYHRMAPRLRDFSELLVDIYEAVQPKLAIMDAIVGMEGNGPAAGNPRNIGLVMASPDGVALDAIASLIIGLEPLKIHTTAIAQSRGLGLGDWTKIEVVGEPLSKLKIKDYDLPSNAMLETMPGFLIKGALSMLKARPVINSNACAGCKFCVESCPVKAMEMSGRVPRIDYNKCIACLCCQELCPQKAVEMKQTHPLGKMLAGMFGHGKRSK